MKPEEFVDALCALKFDSAFNPYADQCPVSDRPNAAELRREALLLTLRAALQSGVESIWIGRDLGYRGGRRTGLALTDDVHMSEYASRWELEVERPTIGPPIAERTAAVIWSVLRAVREPVFLWNVFPLHPHEEGNPFSNRTHNRREGRAGEYFLVALIEILKPKRLVAIGNDAAGVALRVTRSQNVVSVRHPSYGGQRDFLYQLRSSYGMEA